MRMIEKGVPEICLFQSNGKKTFLSNCGMYRHIIMQIQKSTVYEECSISSGHKVVADVLYSCNLAGVQIYLLDEYMYTASLNSLKL